jgi:uncharacterized membrane protein
MDTKRLVIGTLVGAVVLYVVGELIFVLMFGSFYAANVGSATGGDRSAELMWAVALGAVAYAALITLAIVTRPASNIAAGLASGAVVGFLLWFTADFTFYGTTNVANLTRTIVDPLLEFVRGGITGGVITVVLQRIR